MTHILSTIPANTCVIILIARAAAELSFSDDQFKFLTGHFQTQLLWLPTCNSRLWITSIKGFEKHDILVVLQSVIKQNIYLALIHVILQNFPE